MAFENYDFKQNPQSFIQNMNCTDNSIPETKRKDCTDVEIIEKYHDNSREKSLNLSSSAEDTEKKPNALLKPLSPSSMAPLTAKDETQISLKQVDYPVSIGVSKTVEIPKGRARLVRLQAATDTTQQKAQTGESQAISYADDSNHQSSRVPDTAVNASWASASTSSSLSDLTKELIHSSFTSTLEEILESSDRMSPSNSDEIPSLDNMQRFLTADGQYIYNYKDSHGEVHFFYPTANDRESHNEKERKRRSRVSDACSSLRKLIPGLNEKTDKASVFEQAARYLGFIREKYGAHFDQAFCEKYFPGRS